MNYSILRYPGGKTRAVEQLYRYLPANTKEICSPFFGGGSFEFFLNSVGVKIHAYDAFELLCNFWNNIDLLEKSDFPSSITKDRFYELQKSISDEPDFLRSAADFYILNRCSFSGTILSGGFSPKHPRYNEAAIDRLLKFKFDFAVKNLSFEDSIKKHDCLVFADPPYIIKSSLYGSSGDLHKGFDHKLLNKILMDRGNFMLTYNNCAEVIDMYAGCEFHYPEWTYGMSKDKKSKEVLIIKK